MLRAVTRGATRHNLATLGDEARQRADVLVVDLEALVCAKAANLSAPAGAAAHAGAAFSGTTIAFAARASSPSAIITARAVTVLFRSLFVCHCVFLDSGTRVRSEIHPRRSTLIVRL